MTDQIDALAELDQDATFDDGLVPIDRRLLIITEQIHEWNAVAFHAKTAYQTNKAIGASPDELAPLIQQFARARAAASELERVMTALRREHRRG
jgi:hypothetical protein